MNCSINCPQARQRCPSPWACGEGCNFNNAVLPKQSAQEQAAAEFWDMPVQFVGPEPEVPSGYPHSWLDYLPNLWDSMSWWQKVLAVCGLIVVCGMVAGVLTGYGK